MFSITSVVTHTHTRLHVCITADMVLYLILFVFYIARIPLTVTWHLVFNGWFFFIKQKTAYDIGVTGVQTCALPIFISGTRTLVCMVAAAALLGAFKLAKNLTTTAVAAVTVLLTAIYPIWFAQSTLAHADIFEIGRASCRERV